MVVHSVGDKFNFRPFAVLSEDKIAFYEIPEIAPALGCEYRGVYMAGLPKLSSTTNKDFTWPVWIKKELIIFR